MDENNSLAVSHSHSSTAEGKYHDVFHHQENHEYANTKIAQTLLAILITGILGNLLSLIIWKRRKLKAGRMASYMSLLALADTCTLISGIFVRILPKMANIDLRLLNGFSCYFQYFFLGFFSCISAWTLILMTVERFVVIALPLNSSRCLSKCNATALMSLVILISALANSPLVMINSWDSKGHCLVNEHWDDQVKLAIFTLYSPVPIFVLLTLNIAIILRMNRFTNRIERNPDSMKLRRRQRNRQGSITSTTSGGVSVVAYHHARSNTDTNSQSCGDQVTKFTKFKSNKPLTSPKTAPKSFSFDMVELASTCIPECSYHSHFQLPDIVPDHSNTSPPTSPLNVQLTDHKAEHREGEDSPEGHYIAKQIYSAMYVQSGTLNKTPPMASGRQVLDNIDISKSLAHADHPSHLATHKQGGFKEGTVEKRRGSIPLLISQLREKGGKLVDKYHKIRNKKLAAMLLVVTFSYFLLTTPYTLVTYILVYLTTTAAKDDQELPLKLTTIYLAQHILEILLCLNHSINIILYCLTGSKFRSELKAMFSCNVSSAKGKFTTQSGESLASQTPVH